MTQGVGRRSRRHELVLRRLQQYDPRHRLAEVRRQLTARDTRLAQSMTRRMHGADSGFKALAARLVGLSPLAVLGRGYAVCWDDAHTRIVRDAVAVAPGDHVRVTLDRGELRCQVTDASGDRSDRTKAEP
jgi:exodeoxyribonuclease VII large subunit